MDHLQQIKEYKQPLPVLAEGRNNKKKHTALRMDVMVGFLKNTLELLKSLLVFLIWFLVVLLFCIVFNFFLPFFS